MERVLYMCNSNLCRSHRKCFRSILTVHNETGNIWWEKDILNMNKLIKQKLSSFFTWSLYHTTGFRTILTPDQSLLRTLGATCWDASFSSDLLLSSLSITPRLQGSTSRNQLFGTRLWWQILGKGSSKTTTRQIGRSNAHFRQKLVFSSFFTGAVLCLALSTIFHTVSRNPAHCFIFALTFGGA